MAQTKTPYIVGGMLILVFLIGGLATSSTKKTESAPAPIPPASARAVVLPASESRTVVVPPCNTPVSTTVANSAAGRATPGATTVQLPPGDGVRTLLVPNCQPKKTGSTNVEGTIPSAAFVVGSTSQLIRERDGRIEAAGAVAESQLLLADGSSASTIVVPPCTEKPAGPGQDSVLEPDPGNPDLAVGPPC